MRDLNVSVIVPTFNRCDSLMRTFVGLAQQDFRGSWEVIVVSDGSTDNTARVVDDFACRVPFPVRFIEQANSGPARARNHGVAVARGETLLFIDDDVEPIATWIRRHVASYKSRDAVAVIGPMLPDPNQQDVEPVWIGWEHAMLQKQYAAWCSGAWSGVGAHHFYSGNASIQRKYFEAVGGFNESFKRQEDVELATRLEEKCGIHFLFDIEAVGIHRPHRPFSGWLKIPFAYGGQDVARAQTDNGRGAERIYHGYYHRRGATRICADLCLSAPIVSGSLRFLLRYGAQAAYRLKRDHAAFALLSALYNVRYLEGAAHELGSASLLRKRFLHREPRPDKNEILPERSVEAI